MSTIKEEKSFTHGKFFVGNLFMPCECLPVASRNANNKQRYKMKTMTTNQLKAKLRNGPFAWPGGYPLYFIANDGEALSFDAVRENLKAVIWSMRHKVNDGWRVIGCEVNWEDSTLICAHTSKPIESAYGEEVTA